MEPAGPITVHSVCPRGAGGAENAIDAEVAVGRCIAADGDRFVSHPDVTRQSIALGEDRHRAQAEIAARANHAHRDLSAVSNEDLAQDPAILP